MSHSTRLTHQQFTSSLSTIPKPMHRLQLLISGFLLLGLLLPATRSVSAQSNTPENVAPSTEFTAIAERLSDAIQSQVNDKRLPALSIAVIKDGKLIWATGFGLEDQETSRPATALTRYRVGSVSKLFTDLAVMQWVEQGKLDLDAPVTNVIPTFQPTNPFDKPITLRQLMSHRSGLVRESPVGHYFDPDEPGLEATVNSLNQTALVYPPESKTKYSNAGVAVVGRVLEVVANKPFAQAVREQIFTPLDLNASDFEFTPAVADSLADAVMWTHDGREFPAPNFELGTSPAGNLYATVVDLAKFGIAVMDRDSENQILKATTIEQMLEPQFGADGARTFGLGFHVSEFKGRKMVGHGGAVYGYSTQFHLLPDENLGIMIAAAKDGSNPTLTRLAHYGLELMLAENSGQPLPEFELTSPVIPQRALRLDGTYASQEGEQIVLRERNGELYLRRKSVVARLRMLDDELVTDDIHAWGTRLQANDPDHVTLGDTLFRKIPESMPAELPTSWQGLVGEYGWDHNELFIYERDGQLHCLIEWFYHYPLTQCGDDCFAFPDYGLYHGEKLIFSRDESGKADKVVAAEVVFRRRSHGVEDGETFRIEPIRPVDEIGVEARNATPPLERGTFRDSQLVDLEATVDNLALDIRYATTNNFMGAVFYTEPRAFMQQPAAEALAQVQKRLAEQGYGLLIHDAYRPWFVTKMFWDATPADKKIFVANPANGSRHNRGCAVDLSLISLATGKPIDMGAGYDEFSSRSFPDYPVANHRQAWHRELLRDTMEAAGFTIYEFEWWHFDYKDWKVYPIQNVEFEDIPSQ